MPVHLNFSRRASATLICALIFRCLALLAAPVPVEFVLDETQSKIKLIGTVVGSPLKEQGPGSLTTSFTGKLNAIVDGNTIVFPGGSVIDAKTNGVWQPGIKGASGSALADYGGQATILGLVSAKGALRDIVLDVSSGPLSVGNGQFDAAGLVFFFPPNSKSSFDYSASGFKPGGIPLTGLSTNRVVNGATLSSAGGVETLTIDINTEFDFSLLSNNDIAVLLMGKLVGVRGSAPVISSVAFSDKTTLAMRVQGAGQTSRIQSSVDLRTWADRSAEKNVAGNETVFTVMPAGTTEFFRVAQ